MGLGTDPELDREGVYNQESPSGDGMDASYSHQPEHCDWKVVRITVCKCFCMLVVCTNKTLILQASTFVNTLSDTVVEISNTTMPTFSLDSPYTSGEQDFWIPRLGLFLNDEAILESKDQWLTDSIIHAAQQMIKAQPDDIAGLQSPQCGKSATFDPIPHQMKYLSIMHTSGNKWIVVSNITLDKGGSSSMAK